MATTLKSARDDTRRYLKDTTESVWTNVDINAFINDAILVIKNTIPEFFTTLLQLNLTTAVDETPIVMPTAPIDCSYLLGMYASARCFEQDEQHYRAVQKMNEFESRKQEMVDIILDSDEYAALLVANNVTKTDYVVDEYYGDNDSEDSILPLEP